MTDRREHDIIEAFVSLADNLTGDFDVVELLNGLTEDCARLLDVGSAGLLLADRHGTLHVAAATAEGTRALELFQIQSDEGPCLDCFHSGEPVTVPDLHADANRWPRFTQAAVTAGVASVHAIPMRLLDNRLGALGLFGTSVGSLNDDDLRLGQALAHVASVAIVTGTAAKDRVSLAVRLEQVLDGRAVLELAKGLLAEIGDLEVEQAYVALRDYARDQRESLIEIARALIARTLDAVTVLESQSAEQPRRRS